MFDGSYINIFIAFSAGFITFFTSCLLPLVPIYVAYLSGVTIDLLKEGKYSRFSITKSSALFTLGFTSVFILLGATLSTLGRTLTPYKIWIERSGGILFIFFGLFMMGVFKSQILSKNYKISLSSWFKKYRTIYAFLVGVTFGFGWTPCIGPVLAVILYWSTQQETVFAGTILLTAYGLGIGIPFLITGILFEKAVPFLEKTKKFYRVFNYISAFIIIVAGVLLITGHFKLFSVTLLKLFNLNTLAV